MALLDPIKPAAGDKIANGTTGSHISDAKVTYATPELDTEAEIIAAFNTTNGKINAILAILEEFKLLASS